MVQTAYWDAVIAGFVVTTAILWSLEKWSMRSAESQSVDTTGKMIVVSLIVLVSMFLILGMLSETITAVSMSVLAGAGVSLCILSLLGRVASNTTSK